MPPHLMPGMRLQHYKGGLHRVKGACLIEAKLETGILYRPEQGNAIHLLWMRPAAAFDERTTCKSLATTEPATYANLPIEIRHEAHGSQLAVVRQRPPRLIFIG